MILQRPLTIFGILIVITVIGIIATHSFGQSAADYLNQGHSFYTSGKLSDAIAAYEHAVQLQPDDAYSHYCLAVAYSSKNMLEKAAELYEKAIKLDGNFAEAYSGLGVIYQGQQIRRHLCQRHPVVYCDYSWLCSEGLEPRRYEFFS